MKARALVVMLAMRALVALFVAVTMAACGSRTALDVTESAAKSKFLAVVGGDFFSCALYAGGGVWCWGANESGQLGDGTTVGSAVPRRVLDLEGATAIAAGGSHACAILSDRTARCWGSDASGQLGDGRVLADRIPSGSSVPVTVSGLRDVLAISAGDSWTCALLSDRTVECWGDKSFTGLHGVDAGTVVDSPTPVSVLGLNDAVAIAVNTFNACAALSTGEVECWGDNSGGELGTPGCPPTMGPNGSLTSNWCPRGVGGVPDVTGAVGVAVGNFVSCAWLSSGAAECWGLTDGDGDLGRGDVPSGVYPPSSISNLSGAVSIALGWHHGCALTSEGTVLCWGENHIGQIGNGTGVDAYVPVVVPGVIGATALGVGAQHTCAILLGASIVCWGDNTYGQLGNGGGGADTCNSSFDVKSCVTTPVGVVSMK